MMNAPTPHKCHWTLNELRDNIVGINSPVPLLDGSSVPYVFLDNGASTPVFQHVMEVMNSFMNFYSGVHRGTGFKSMLATKIFDETHGIAGQFVNANLDTNTVIFVKNTTEAINKLANRCDWQEGDVVITSLMEHHSNDLPWRKYAKVIHIPVDDMGFLNEEVLEKTFEEHKGKVRFMAITGASNITGIINPIHKYAEMAHSYGALMFVDAAQLAPHRKIDVLPDDNPGHIDFIAYSAHKMYAPLGIGVLIGPRSWFSLGDPDAVGGGVVDIVEENFVAFSGPPASEEAGSPNVPGAVALAASIDMLKAVGMDKIAQHEYELITYAMKKLKKVPSMKIYGPADEPHLEQKVGVIAFELDGIPHSKVAAILSAEGGIGVRNGCFCAHPYVKRLLQFDESHSKEITDEILAGDRSRLPGMVRASFGCYNSIEDVDRLVDMLHRIAADDYKGDYVLDKKSGGFWPKNFDYDFSFFFPHFSFKHRSFAENYDEAS